VSTKNVLMGTAFYTTLNIAYKINPFIPSRFYLYYYNYQIVQSNIYFVKKELMLKKKKHLSKNNNAI
jgi:hypothetical protein